MDKIKNKLNERFIDVTEIVLEELSHDEISERADDYYHDCLGAGDMESYKIKAYLNYLAEHYSAGDWAEENLTKERIKHLIKGGKYETKE